MALPTYLDLSIMRGDSKTWTFTLVDEDAVALPALTNAWFTAKRQLRDADANAVFQLTLGVGIVDDGGGVIRVTAAGTATAALPGAPVNLHYDLQVKPTGGAVQTALYGALAVQPDVTRATA
ncbi:MAG: hypothetical protein H0V29_03930 [Thermoleophilaceae bacterium]|nr:hypothetical protein [Thermoleophilaceae bacterium]